MCIAITLIMFVPASAQGTTVLSRRVIASGGIVSGRLMGAIGQPVAGTVKAASGSTLCSGFWCGDQTVTANVGQALVTYRVTFGQLGIALAVIAWLVIRVGGGLYRFARQLPTRKVDNA